MIQGLFDSLREEAPVMLLFLKNVQSISVHKCKGDGDSQCLFKVEVSEHRRKEVERRRQKLVRNAKESTVTMSRYVFDVRVISDSETKKFRWLILNQIGSTEKRVIELSEKLGLLPWIGCAVPINDAINECTGRVFCFLPLPPDVDCETGLPVHVHGYFGVMDNRRGLVWPGNECQNNEIAEWNELLLENVGSVVYSKTLEALVTDRPKTGLSEKQRRQLVYYTLPDLNKVRGHWRGILKPLFKQLVHQQLFYCQSASGSSWITLKEGILDRLRESGVTTEMRNAVLKTLLDNGLVIIADLPKHVNKIICAYFGKLRFINPTLVRAVLKGADVKVRSREDKLFLLGYVLSDSRTIDLSDVPLLPLASGKFITFRSHRHASDPSSSVFVPNGDCTAVLLPNMSNRFLDETIPEGVAKNLHALASTDINKENPTQLVKLTNDIVVQNLSASLPSKWFTRQCDKVQWNPNNSSHPPERWLEDIWHWIRVSYPGSLKPLQGIPLIPLPPLTKTINKCLGVLSEFSKFIFASDDSGNRLPSRITCLLTACGCTVLTKVPSYFRHPRINSYVAPPTPAGALLVLSRASPETVRKHIKSTSTAKDRSLIRDFFCRLPERLSIDQKQFLLQLPLFDTFSGSGTAVRVDGQILEAASSDFRLPSGFKLVRSEQIISSTDPRACQLLTSLEVDILKPAAVFVRYLFPDIRAMSVYNMQETTFIMLWILQQIIVFKDQHETFLEEIKALPFVSTDEGQMKKPTQLYDPNDAVLLDLFAEETNKFPAKDFTDTKVISVLKGLGLRIRSKLTPVELLKVAVELDTTLCPVSQLFIRKIQALVEILQDNPVYLNKFVDGSVTLKHKLFQLKWLPRAKRPPKNSRFPKFVTWYNSDTQFFAPAQLRSKSQALLVGSSMPILDIEMNDKLQKEFGLTSDPPVDQVVRQLQTAVESWQHQDHGKSISKFQKMLKVIYLHLSQISDGRVSQAFNDISLKQWVWHGSGFCSPVQISLEREFFVDLRPHLFLLPDEFKARNSLTEFFLRHGVRRKFSEGAILDVLVGIRDKHASYLSGKIKKHDSKLHVENDLKLCRCILEWVVKNGKTLPKSLQKKVLVPVQNSSKALVLQPCKKCTYCDRDWLRHGGSELDIPGDYLLIHDSIPVNVARLLGVPPLSTCLLSAETVTFEFEQTGPYEPLTTRLNNILKEYKEGVGVFKELIQNADDAGATKVRFLIDWRYGPKEKLLLPKMAECQGPALWAYNNAVFTDKDFENIIKLAGATKVEDLAKIGRFGLGFNAVYHLTDVPSFVSREYFVIFDPNVHHLQSHIKDKSRPGIRINLATNPRPLSAFEDQFLPYHGIFGCNTLCKEREKFHYDGTLFRFPFRTLRQASESEICQRVYDEKKVKAIVGSLKESASLLLLYTQHVDDVELYELGKGNNPKMMQLVLSVKKNVKNNIGIGRGSPTVPFIKECSDWWKGKLMHENRIQASPLRFELMAIDINEMATDLVDNTDQSVNEEIWLLSSCVGTESSARLALGEGRERGFLPYGGVAAKLSNFAGCGSMNTVKLIPEAVKGEAFCFLPLSIATGLPVHINGYFAITSNRRGIWERSTSDQVQPLEVLWNESLMQDALSNAYLHLLEMIKCLFEGENLRYSFDILWPCYGKLQSNTWETLVKNFYTKLVKEALPLFRSNGKWLDIHSGYILAEDLRKAPGALETLRLLGQNLFDLTVEVCFSLTKSGHDETLQRRTLTLENFLKGFFFPNIARIPKELRDPLVWFGLDCILSGQKDFEPLFKENTCIVCSADGLQLAKPRELVNPKGAAARLFATEDCRFPVGEEFLADNRLYVLEQLGMVKDQLSWEEICGRAKSIEELAALSYKRGLRRVRNLVKYLNGNILELPKENDEIVRILQSTNFLPFMSETPSHYGLPWKGSEYRQQFFHSPKDLFMLKDKNLVGSCFLIVDDSEDKGCGDIGHELEQLLGFSRRGPRNDQVLLQLDTTINAWSEMSEKKRKAKKTMVESVCRSIYKHLNGFVIDAIKKKSASGKMAVEHLKAELESKTWLFVRSSFVSSEKVARIWTGDGAPFLYGLPEEYSTKYGDLLQAARVKKFFDKTDFINALHSLKVSKEGLALTDHELKIAVCFLNELNDAAEDLLKENADRLCLPGTNKVLYQSDELTINNTPWLKDRGDARYVHKDITPDLAFKLGAKSLQDRRLKKYSNTFGRPFGQHEKLTDRLKNILKAYRCDSGILKELVQNADDAQATEIHFIHDTRELPCKRVFQKNAKEVQGPALCVYNNRPFSDKDLEGIQNLGIGSKTYDPETTGQYGIGFNAVYHLTDCPSFLSNNDTLCVLDPHCRYAPEATQEFPGEQFRPIDEGFKEDFADALSGYLSEHFKLRGSTMFRLPLRSRDRCQSSLISQTNANAKISSLLETFQSEAKKALLFLNHIKKISLAKIDHKGRLKRTYEVSSIMNTEDEKKRQNIFSLMKMYKNVPSCEVPWQGVTYPMILSDSNRITEEWLVHQCLGVENLSPDDEIPDGRSYGLLPRAGIAAFVSAFCSQTSSSYKRRHVAYCFLPLPVYTPLPVHVNGHFALDPSRRALWKDTDPNKPLTKWNNFIKSHVLAPGYAALILEARHYMPHGERDPNDKTNCYFPSELTADVGLHWYHNLFPDLSETKDEWKTLAVAVYRFLGRTRAPVLPVVVVDEADKDERPMKLPRRIRSWLPSQEGFFVERSSKQEPLWKVLLQIRLPLLVNSPTKICDGFKEAEVTSCLVSAERVINVLRTFHESTSKCEIGDLPSKLEHTMVRGIAELKELIAYCKTEEDFVSLLIGLPLLLTADGKLRVFNTDNPVYCSDFSDLFPNRTHLFVHPKLVNDLSDTIMNGKDESTPQILRHLTVSSLASFIPDVFPPSMRAATKHMPYPDESVLTKEWFKRLWKFLQYYAQLEEPETQVSLKALGEWPIIPTTSEELVTIDNAKTVLDMTESGTEGPREKKIINFLRKLQCPSLDKDITFVDLNANEPVLVSSYVTSSSFRSQGYAHNQPNQKTMAFTKLLNRPTAVTDPYVAHPNNVADVLQVLDYMRKMEILDESKLTGDEIFIILQFFQDDYENLEPKETYDKILKGLRLYKAINNAHYNLLSFSSYALVPGGVPVKEIEKLQRCTGCLFLHSDALPTLTTLYEGLGAGAKRTVSRFYEEYILPNFYIFSRESEMEYLAHIRDKVLPRFDETKEKQAFLDFLKDIRCIPGNDGHLHRVREFYNPRNSVFRIMLDKHSNQFPPSPFDETEWLKFLAKIGLKSDVGEREFLEYCRKIASDANRSRLGETAINRSKELVKYLLTEDHLREPQFLVSVSTIKFIASEKANPNLLSLHKQYQCEDESQHPPFLQFSNSVPWKYQKLVWTSAPLLPEYAQPDNELSCCLRIQESPSVDAVISHLQNISGSLAETSNKEEALPQPKVLKQIMKCIYDFFLQSTEACERDITDHCSQECKNIGNRLRSIPCILVEDEKVLVKGDQLSFDALLETSLHPFLYAVPREYGNYDHILKRLGATEEITSLQMAKLFKTMKDRCKEGKINPNFELKAQKAMFLLFKSVFKESCGGKKESKISSLAELYLPSEDKRLVKSTELVCQVPPRHLRTVAKLKYQVLYSLERCDLPRAQENEYLQALPEHLRPQRFGRIASERLDRSCLNSPCQRCQENATCDFIERHIMILKSKEFQNGIVRLLKHQKKANELTEDEMEMSSRLSSAKVQIKCMESIKVHLILRKTGHPLENSSMDRSCFVVNENDSWILYIHHDNGGKNKQSVLSKSVNKILDWLLTDECLLVVTDMLSCESPSQIAGVINQHDIQRDFNEEELELGREVPIAFHYLMQQNPLFVFYEGEIVAFGVEMKEVQTEEEALDDVLEDEPVFVKYVLAEVTKCVQSNRGGKSYDFEARYVIDLGNETKEVSVLDLYKFYQNDPDENLSRDMVPYTGDPSSKPTDIDDAKREIREALRAAWRLPPEMRRKVISRLYLRWHPDKNPNNKEFATEMMAFLLNEVKRMEKEERHLAENLVNFRSDETVRSEYDGLFRRCNTRARREHETFWNYRSVFGGSPGTFSGTSDYTYPDPRESRRWLEQSFCDIEAAEFLVSATRPFNALACFLSHQIVEKSLKAALYAKCGLTKNQLHSHDVYSLAQNVSCLTGAPDKVVELALIVGNYYLPTRYPNRQPRPLVPARAFSREQSTRAVQTARELLKLVECFMGE